MRFLLIFLLCLPSFSVAVHMPEVFASHMVMQRNSDIKIWGWGRPREKITVSTSWDEAVYKAEVDNQGNWHIAAHTNEGGGPYTITINGYNKIILEDVLLGEVWICSGQSNMEWSANSGIDDAEQHIAEANHPNIRFFDVETMSAESPQRDVSGTWSVCTSETMASTSAIGYFFARELSEKLGVPAGMINSTWGGTAAEAWTPEEVIAGSAQLSEGAALLTPVPWGPIEPGRIYNAMIHPLISYSIAGVIWYQGESNVGNAAYYQDLKTSMVKSWRTQWGIQFPFYFAQIAPYSYSDFQGAALRDAQRRCLESIPQSGMVMTSDIGDTTDIHPKNKLDVGLRFGKMALATHYGVETESSEGPLPTTAIFESEIVRISFANGEGLYSRSQFQNEFEVMGEDGQWQVVRAVVEEEMVRLQCDGIREPKMVRFEWKDNLVPTLFNGAGLPASSFLLKKSD